MAAVQQASAEAPLRAADLAAFLEQEVFDVEEAARFLGVERNSVDYAVLRRRLPCVQLRNKRLFTRADLIDYNNNRGKGAGSGLEEAYTFVVEPKY